MANYPTAIPLIHCKIHTKYIFEIQIPETITDDGEIIPLSRHFLNNEVMQINLRNLH